MPAYLAYARLPSLRPFTQSTWTIQPIRRSVSSLVHKNSVDIVGDDGDVDDSAIDGVCDADAGRSTFTVKAFPFVSAMIVVAVVKHL